MRLDSQASPDRSRRRRVDDAGLVLDFVLDPEGRRVHEDRVQRVVVAAPAEHQQAGERRDRGADLVGDDEAVAADELLLGEEGAHEAVVARARARPASDACSGTLRSMAAIIAGTAAAPWRPCVGARRSSGPDEQPREHGGRAERNRRGRARHISPVSSAARPGRRRTSSPCRWACPWRVPRRRTSRG